MKNQELTSKLKKYSKNQLLNKLATGRHEAEEDQIIRDILIGRGHVFEDTLTEAATEAPVEAEKVSPKQDAADDLLGPVPVAEAIENNPAADPKPKKEDKPKKVKNEIPVITSAKKEIQIRIDSLQDAVGKKLEDLKANLVAEGIDIGHIVFLHKGDTVEFDAAKNSKLNGTKLKGIVLRNNELDRSGRKYCRIKVEGQGTFQKSQISVTRLALGTDDLA